jgi:hypothetical protein
MRRPLLGFSASPAGVSLLLGLAILTASLAIWHGGYRPRFPLEHSNVAYSLATGAGYSNPFGVSSGPTAWVPPGIPLFYSAAISLAWALGIDERAPIVGLNLLAATLAAFLALRVCLAGWKSSSRAVFCAAFLFYGILDPDFLVSTGPMTAASCALLLAGLAAAFREPGGLSPWVMLAGSNTLLAMIHPGLALAGILASVAVGLTVAKTGAGRPVAFARSAAFAAIAGFALGAGPWTLRNHLVFHQWIPFKSNGCFELALSQDETEDGVLSEASLVAGHPSTNPRLMQDYARLGESAFLEPYRIRAAKILTGELGRYLDFSFNRLVNATCLSRSPSNIEMLSVQLPPAEAARLVGQGLILMCAGAPNFFWARNTVPSAVELAGFKSAGVERPDALLADWARAQSKISARTEGADARLTGFAWSGLPTLCLAAALIVGRRSTPRLVLGAAAIYLVALLPNILITHDIRHQGSFMLLFALFAAGAVEALARRIHA